MRFWWGLNAGAQEIQPALSVFACFFVHDGRTAWKLWGMRVESEASGS